MMNRGSSLTSVVLAVAAAVGVGVGGYFVLGGCSSCETETATAAAATPVATEKADSCCAVEGEALVETVANEGESCCSEEAQATKIEGGDCCKDVAGEAQTVALEGEACDAAKDCEGKTDCDAETECEEKTDCEGKVCPITGEAIELTDAETSDNGNG